MINLNTDELNINQQISMYAMAKFFAKNRKDGVAAGGTGQFENGQYNPGQNPGQNQAGESENEEDDENNRDGSSMSIEWPEWDFKSLGGVWEVIYFLITFPITLVLKFIPDMKFKKVKNIWNGWIVIPSFVFCLVAITGTSYCMVWWTTRLGETWNVDREGLVKFSETCLSLNLPIFNNIHVPTFFHRNHGTHSTRRRNINT